MRKTHQNLDTREFVLQCYSSTRKYTLVNLPYNIPNTLCIPISMILFPNYKKRHVI